MMRSTTRAAISAAIIALITLAGITFFQTYSVSNRETTSITQSSQLTTASTYPSTTTSSSAQTTSSLENLLSFATLSIRLTDPPVVPAGTKSLDLSYSLISLLARANNTVPIKNIQVNSSGTVDLLSIQNVSQTVALIKLPNGTVIYWLSFLIKDITILINGTYYPVQPVLSSNELKVVLYPPETISNDSILLVEVNPVVIRTQTGYQLIPSAVAIVSQGSVQNDTVGQKHEINKTEESKLAQARPEIVSAIKSFTTTGNRTTISVQVNNTGKIPVNLVGLSIHSVFSVVNCKHGEDEKEHCMHPETIFLKVYNTTQGACLSAFLTPGGEEDNAEQVQLDPGQCALLTFSGIIMSESGQAIVPYTQNNSVVKISVIALNGAEQAMSCTYPFTTASCTSSTNNEED